MDASFKFRQFSVSHGSSALKLGTDAVLLGAAMSISGRERRALDIGTGCGVIALMAAQRSALCRITGIDIDLPSVQEAARNFAASPWADRLEAVHCSLEEFSPQEPGNGYELIFSNPPYYDDSLKNPDERSAAARHTHSLPHTTLCSRVRELLAEDGRFCVVLPCDVFIRFRRTAASFGLYLQRELDICATPSKPVSRTVAEFGTCNTGKVVTERLVLQENGSKSTAYKELTKEFYL